MIKFYRMLVVWNESGKPMSAECGTHKEARAKATLVIAEGHGPVKIKHLRDKKGNKVEAS